MPRPKRVWFPGATYHIMDRGNYKQNIYKETEDYEIFLEILKDTMKKYYFKIHSFCLMTNHYHLLIETTDKEIWHIMKRINQLYAAYFNEKYAYVGHLFQGRYVSRLIEDDNYFLQTSRYIHLNPVKANMVSCPVEYKWSSYETFIGNKDTIFVTKERVMGYFSGKIDEYQRFVEGEDYSEHEEQIRCEMKEDEEWLPENRCQAL